MARKQRYPAEKQSGWYVKPLVIKNSVQENYKSFIEESTITYGVGPAGTGKTYIATHVALEELLSGEKERVILTRPIVAVEDIGYLPGDMNEKIHPYMLPLFDALEDHLGPTKAKEMLEDGRIEVVPLAYMRGRTLKNAFIILDEAQNTTPEQMKMFLTRIGYNSKMVITGDLRQSDLDRRTVPVTGLQYAVERLKGVSGDIAVVEFMQDHIVRHPLIELMLSRLENRAPIAQDDDSSGIGAPPARTRHSFSEDDAPKAVRKPRLFGGDSA